MSIISLFSASHCHGDEVAEKVGEALGYPILTNEHLLATTAQQHGVDTEKVLRAMHGQRSVFDRFTHEKERHVALVRATLAELMQTDNVVYHGLAGHLLPATLPHVLRVCLAGKADYRAGIAASAESIDAKAAKKLIAKGDEERTQWTLYLFGLSPWDESLYDILLPMDRTPVDEAVRIIVNNANKPAVRSTRASQQAMVDFLLTARVQVQLAQAGHHNDVDVATKDGNLLLTLNKYVMRVEHLKDELRDIAKRVQGVNDIDFKVGPHFRPPNVFAKMDIELPPKVLLVDDEKEFVLTLSERLQTRNLQSAVAYDGEQALSIVEDDAPDVMVLDINMPGINGLEVLRRVKQEKPYTEVIILTGHGSEKERLRAEDLGAFAYLHKPVDIDVLADTMKQAYAKLRAGRSTGGEGDA
jgi:CheY-like chemotaxis protein/cytidylate kinase